MPVDGPSPNQLLRELAAERESRSHSTEPRRDGQTTLHAFTTTTTTTAAKGFYARGSSSLPPGCVPVLMHTARARHKPSTKHSRMAVKAWLLVGDLTIHPASVPATADVGGAPAAPAELPFELDAQLLHFQTALAATCKECPTGGGPAMI